VVFITARTQQHEVAQLRALGAEGVIAKPFDPMALAGQVRDYLR
jgi:CheY-like chemotaxis protein